VRYNNDVDRGGQTVSATEFARLTGVSRERLRTWERRYGFPQPARVAQGPRRYAIADAPRVVAVRRAADQGVPLPRAIEDAAAPPASGVSDATLGSVAAASPLPIVLVSGPEPLRVRYANAPERALAGAGAVAAGQELDALPWFLGSDLERTLRTLFAGDQRALECGHPAWDGGEATERSLAYRLPAQPGAPPTVALVGLSRGDERIVRRELVVRERELEQVRLQDDHHRRWIALAATLAERFQRDADDSLLATVATTLVRGLGAADAGIAVYVAGELALGSSSRQVLGPRMVTVTGYDDLVALMHAGDPAWLAPTTANAFGVPDGLHALAVPVTVVGETLGLLVLVFEERVALDDDARRMLTVVSAGLGFTLLRDRLIAGAREAERGGP
jgi:MerR family transcriptional regulator, light-induced transcriptional regulator